MNKELFIKTMEQIKELVREQDAFNDVLSHIDPEFGGGYIYSKPINILSDLLKSLMNDKYDNISYYMWELNFGDNYEDGMITDQNNNIIPLKTPEDLYNLIIDSQE